MIFLLMVGTLVVLMHLYLWRRLVRDTMRPGRARRVSGFVVLGLGVLLFGTLLGSRWVEPSIARWFAWPGYVWFGLMGYLFLFLALLELPRLALRRWARRGPLEATATSAPERDTATPERYTATPERDTTTPERDTPTRTRDTATQEGDTAARVGDTRRVFLARVCAVTAGAASAGLAGGGMVAALGAPEVTRVPVALRRLPAGLAGFRIAVVADVHLGPLLGRGHTERVVRMVNETEPDLVAIVGDLVDGTVEQLGSAAEPLRDLVSREGTFFVTGNHEYYSGFAPWIAELERLGVHPLRNERTVIRGGLELAGVNDVNGRSYSDGPDMDRALAGRDPERPVVLLAHQPIQVRDAAARGVDLQLSGHTHGGQLYPFHYVVRAFQPAIAGLSKVDDTWLYVNRGVGFWAAPVRVGADPEITVIEVVGDGGRV